MARPGFVAEGSVRSRRQVPGNRGDKDGREGRRQILRRVGLGEPVDHEFGERIAEFGVVVGRAMAESPATT